MYDDEDNDTANVSSTIDDTKLITGESVNIFTAFKEAFDAGQFALKLYFHDNEKISMESSVEVRVVFSSQLIRKFLL